MIDPDVQPCGCRGGREAGDLARLVRHVMVRPLDMRGVRSRARLSADGHERSEGEDRRYHEKTPEHRFLRIVPT